MNPFIKSINNEIHHIKSKKKKYLDEVQICLESGLCSHSGLHEKCLDPVPHCCRDLWN